MINTRRRGMVSVKAERKDLLTVVGSLVQSLQLTKQTPTNDMNVTFKSRLSNSSIWRL